uniref:Uncharacterized protein n=1 Tax=Schizaphis graminum TaxID=13262 RepID=A0A2S2NVZ5_SCHGA
MTRRQIYGTSHATNYYCYEHHNLLFITVKYEFYVAAQVPATTSVWDFGGTWSSKLAGVRFVIDAHSTVGIDNSIPVKIVDMAVGTKSNGFLNKDWMAKASTQYGHLGPVSLSAINRADKNVAVFIGNSRLGDFCPEQIFYNNFLLL